MNEPAVAVMEEANDAVANIMTNHVGNRQIISLNAENEFRVEVLHRDETVKLEITKGTAEIFGSELIIGKVYTFTKGAKFAVFTWKSCEIAFESTKTSWTITDKTSMPIYFNLHCSMENIRQEAIRNNKERGPVLMIVGPEEVGKTTLSKILLNYAVRSENPTTPLFVDLNIKGGNLSIPGMMAASTISNQLSVISGFSQKSVLARHYGYISLLDHPDLFSANTTKLADAIEQELTKYPNVKRSGMIINTFAWTQGKSYQHLMQVTLAFEIDMIVVMSSERLYNELIRDMPCFVKVVLIGRNDGAINVSGHRRRDEFKVDRIKNYFYGDIEKRLKAHTITIKYSELKIFKIESSSSSRSRASRLKCTKIDCSKISRSRLKNRILSMVFGLSSDCITDSNVAGFVCVKGLDTKDQTLTLLSPVPEPFPKCYLVWSDVFFKE